MLRALLVATVVWLGGAAVAHAAPGAAITGTVTGTVTFDGPAPERVKVRRDTDLYCARTEQVSEDVIVSHGRVKDALVRIKNGTFPVEKSAPPPAPAVIDQQGCSYAPHVIGVVAGQQLSVRNSDGTFHNVHGSIHGQLTWNKPAIPGEPALTLDNPGKAGDVIDVVCDVHPWMHAYAVVQDHARFAVTGDDGAFALGELSPGSYTLEAWHPVMGMKRATVRVVAGKPSTVTFTYRPADVK
ncbi:MAG TPA: carboxypeptidase regulatory-like domain-containing protein [Kofleriaceae bacterium]